MNPILALIIANIIWGAAAPIFKYSLTNIPPFTLAFIRFFFAGLLFLPFVWRFRFFSLTKFEWAEIIVSSLFGITLNISAFFLGLQKSESINAPIIASAGPLFLFILSVIFLREKIRYRVLWGMIVSLLGVFTIIFSPLIFEGKTMGVSAFEGNLLFALATFGAVISPLAVRSTLKKRGPYVVTFISFIFAGLTFVPGMTGELHTWSFSQLNTAGIVGIVFGIFFSSALAYYLYYYGLSKISMQELGIFTYVDPVVAVLIAIPLVHEYPTLYFFIGSILVFLGIYVSEGRIHYHPFYKMLKYTLWQKYW